MSFKESIKKVLISLGKNNKPTYAVMAIAVVKGVARPLFTLSDKHADPETKKYTAIREALTEVVAIPTYFACGELAGKVAGKLKLSPEKQALARSNFMFLGVCAAALLVIPALASVTIKPFMKKIQDNKKNSNKELEKVSEKLDIIDIDDDFEVDKLKDSPVFKACEISKKPYSNTSSVLKTDIIKVGGLW